MPLVSVQRLVALGRALRGAVGLAESTFMATFTTAHWLATRGPNGPPLWRVVWHGLCSRFVLSITLRTTSAHRTKPLSEGETETNSYSANKELCVAGHTVRSDGRWGASFRARQAGAHRNGPGAREASWSAVVPAGRQAASAASAGLGRRLALPRARLCPTAFAPRPRERARNAPHAAFGPRR